jgi:hypothetical protein
MTQSLITVHILSMVDHSRTESYQQVESVLDLINNASYAFTRKAYICNAQGYLFRCNSRGCCIRTPVVNSIE